MIRKTLVVAGFLCTFSLSLASAASKTQSSPAETKQVAAANCKIGYADFEYILRSMPAFSKVHTQVQARYKEFEKKLKVKQAEYEKMIRDYQELESKNAGAGPSVIPAATLEKRQQAIYALREEVQSLAMKSEGELQEYNQKLLMPLYEQIQAAINKVAAMHNYTHIFRTSLGANTEAAVPLLLYASADFDITKLVQAHLAKENKSSSKKKKKSRR